MENVVALVRPVEAASGDEAAFAEALTVEIPRLRRYAIALLRDRNDADDLVQDTLMRALSRRQLWRCGTDLRAWLFTIMHNEHIDRMRRLSRHRGTAIAEEPSAEPAAEASIMLRELSAALDALPADQRATILLVGLEGMSYEEVAAVQGIPIGTVRSRVSRARENLRAALGATAPEPRKEMRLRVAV